MNQPDFALFLSGLGYKFYLIDEYETFLLWFLIVVGFLPILSTMAQVKLTATSGTATGSFSTLGAAIADINAGTHKGNIVIKISANTTETANVSLSASGSGSANYTSIKVLPADTATTVKTVSLNVSGTALLTLNGADNVTIDGRPNETGTQKLLKFINLATTASSHGAVLTAGASNNTFRYFTIGCSSTGGTATSSIRLTTGTNSSNLFDNLIVDGGNLGIEINGTNGTPNTDNTIQNCSIINQQATGVRLAAGVGNTSIDKNVFMFTDKISTTGGYQPFNITQVEPTATVSITRNRAYDIKTSAANFIHGIFISPSVASGAIIARNNSFILGTSTYTNNLSQAIRGVLFTGTLAASLTLENNTFRIGGVHQSANGNPTSVGVYKSNTSATAVFVCRNNLMVNTRTGTTSKHVGGFYPASGNGTNTIDYNTYVGSDTAHVSLVSGAFFKLLSAYKTAASTFDQNSQFGMVNFVNDTDPDISNNNYPDLLTGTPLASVPTDINGTTRNASFPFKGAYEGNLSLLPLSLGTKSVSVINGNVLVKWTTYNEVNVSSFDLERSTDGVNFNRMGAIAAKGAAQNTYSYTDYTPFVSLSDVLYYRIKEIDVNGSVVYHALGSVAADPSSSFELAVLNAASSAGSLTVLISVNKSVAGSFSIVDMSGKKIEQVNLDLVKGENRYELKATAGLAKGVYLLHAEIPGNQKTLKFIKE